MDTPAPSHCPNCGSALSLPKPRYCGECGQETTLQPPSVPVFVREFTGQYLSTQGALLRSLLTLLRPGELTQEYLRGRRRHYVLPLRLYMATSMAALLSIWLISVLLPLPESHRHARTYDPQFARHNNLDRREATYLTYGLIVQVGQRAGEFVCRGLPASRCQDLRHQWEQDPQSLAREQALRTTQLSKQAHLLFLLLVPFLALGTYLAYFSRKLSYGTHLVASLHVHAAGAFISLTWSLIFHITAASSNVIMAGSLLSSLLYLTLSCQRWLGGRRWATLIRVLLTMVIWQISYFALYLLWLDALWWRPMS
ncbi:hypothetical protein C1O66_12585 [Paucibacter aquatile]|jgi:hypothetical protein|uniref:DUF3667 domain-containing protein n=1 Tax=Kinneretia aquatilis TaxID=2070761 RepID=A0A2N8KXV2_9BURK|nr:hypothetical protein C1O66_12585 [Paucibacter aquatile]